MQHARGSSTCDSEGLPTTSELLHFFLYVCHLEQDECKRILELYERLGMSSLAEFRQHVNAKILSVIGIQNESIEHILKYLDDASALGQMRVSCSKHQQSHAPDGFYIETPSPQHEFDLKTPEAFFARPPTAQFEMEEEDYQYQNSDMGGVDGSYPHPYPYPILHSPRRIQLVGSEVMFRDLGSLEGLTAAAEMDEMFVGRPVDYHNHSLLPSLELCSESETASPERSRAKETEAGADKAKRKSISQFKHKYPSYPLNPFVVYQGRIRKRDNYWSPTTPPLSARLTRAQISHSQSLPDLTSVLSGFAPLKVYSIDDVLHSKGSREMLKVECPYWCYSKHKGLECPKRELRINLRARAEPCPRLELGHNSLDLAHNCKMKAKSSGHRESHPNCNLRRINSTRTLEEMERGMCSVGDDNSSDSSDLSSGDEREREPGEGIAIASTVQSSVHSTNGDKSFVSGGVDGMNGGGSRLQIDCPSPLAPTNVEQICRPSLVLTPKSRGAVGLGFGWQSALSGDHAGVSSSSTSASSDSDNTVGQVSRANQEESSPASSHSSLRDSPVTAPGDSLSSSKEHDTNSKNDEEGGNNSGKAEQPQDGADSKATTSVDFCILSSGGKHCKCLKCNRLRKNATCAIV